jgi:endonuclease/exonuclease/phosphatase family metal-dependent hydrolase
MPPAITDPVPAEFLPEWQALKASLDTVVPLRTDTNVLIGTWNLRAFGDLTEKWASAPNDSPRRDLFSVRCIAEVVSRFDVVAIQEVRDNIKCLRHMLKALGPDWGVIMTDVTLGGPGNGERMSFVFNSRRVAPSGLAGELVVPPEQTDAINQAALNTQFARTPYAVSFRTGDTTFILVTLHVKYGTGVPAERIPELKAIAVWLRTWAQREKSWGHNFIALGDFNIDRKDDPLYQAFTSTGLTPPAELADLPRTIFDTGADKHFYDQIAWFNAGSGVPQLAMTYNNRAGNFDFPSVILKQLDKTQLSWRISDHYPLWCEFKR